MNIIFNEDKTNPTVKTIYFYNNEDLIETFNNNFSKNFEIMTAPTGVLDGNAIEAISISVKSSASVTMDVLQDLKQHTGIDGMEEIITVMVPELLEALATSVEDDRGALYAIVATPVSPNGTDIDINFKIRGHFKLTEHA